MLDADDDIKNGDFCFIFVVNLRLFAKAESQRNRTTRLDPPNTSPLLEGNQTERLNMPQKPFALSFLFPLL